MPVCLYLLPFSCVVRTIRAKTKPFAYSFNGAWHGIEAPISTTVA